MSRGNIILLSIIGVLLLIIAFGIGWLVFASNQAVKAEQGEVESKYDWKKSKLYPVAADSIVSNLNTGDVKDKRMIRVKVQFRVADDKIIKKLDPETAVIVDNIISILRAKTPEEIIKPEAKEVIKQEIISKLNHYFETDKILDVYFEEFIVQ